MRLVVTFSLSVMLLSAAKPTAPAELFDPSQVWSVHLRFTQEQWAAMEPKGGPQGGGMPFGPPGGPGGRGPGRGGFGPAMMLAPGFLKADQNNDGKVSADEFRTLGEGWFQAWDEQRQGKLSEAEVRDGAASTFTMDMPPMPGGPGGGRGPGGPGRSMLGPEGGRNGASAMSGIQFDYVHADVEFNGTAMSNVAVRYKGNSTFMQSRGSLKRSMKINLNKYVKGQKYVGQTELNLHSNVTDAAWMNEPLSYRLFRDGKVPAPRTSYAKVYLTVTGKYDKQYLGLYSLVEDVGKEFAVERFGSREGAIFKPSTPSLFSYLGDDWAKYNQTYDPKTDLTAQQKQRVIDFSKLVTSGSDADFTAQLPQYLDIDETARYLALNVWLANMDSILSMGQNFYVYLHPKSNQFQILPWDLDLSFGGMGGGAELSIERPFSAGNRFLERLFKAEAFRKPYLAYMAEFNNTILASDRVAGLVEETAKVIRPAIAEESAEKLQSFDDSVAGKAAAGGGRGFGGPGPGRGNPIKAFTAPRNSSVKDQLAGKSQGQQGGRGGPGGRGGGPGGFNPGGFNPGGFNPGGFNPGMMLAPMLTQAVDENKDGSITRAELLQAMAKWHTAWGGDKGPITEQQLRDGINRDMNPQPGR